MKNKYEEALELARRILGRFAATPGMHRTPSENESGDLANSLLTMHVELEKLRQYAKKTGGIAVQLTQCAEELGVTKGVLTRTQQQLEKAEEVIRFYANPENWSRRDTLFGECIDRSDCKDYKHITRDVRLTGGHRARSYFANKQERIG